jgi:succinate dehydrogenase / fumarate reductase iron-sulfur subunit
MVKTMDACGFGNCSNERECEAVCPKEIKITNIARFNREFLKASFVSPQQFSL